MIALKGVFLLLWYNGTLIRWQPLDYSFIFPTQIENVESWFESKFWRLLACFKICPILRAKANYLCKQMNQAIYF